MVQLGVYVCSGIVVIGIAGEPTVAFVVRMAGVGKPRTPQLLCDFGGHEKIGCGRGWGTEWVACPIVEGRGAIHGGARFPFWSANLDCSWSAGRRPIPVMQMQVMQMQRKKSEACKPYLFRIGA